MSYLEVLIKIDRVPLLMAPSRHTMTGVYTEEMYHPAAW